MKAVRLSIIAGAAVALTTPLVGLAATPATVAADNCAHALARHLHARLAGIDQQPAIPTSPLANYGPHEQIILDARAPSGRQTGPMVCTVDRNGRVLSLQRPAPVDNMPLVDAATAR